MFQYEQKYILNLSPGSPEIKSYYTACQNKTWWIPVWMLTSKSMEKKHDICQDNVKCKTPACSSSIHAFTQELSNGQIPSTLHPDKVVQLSPWGLQKRRWIRNVNSAFDLWLNFKITGNKTWRGISPMENSLNSAFYHFSTASIYLCQHE